MMQVGGEAAEVEWLGSQHMLTARKKAVTDSTALQQARTALQRKAHTPPSLIPDASLFVLFLPATQDLQAWPPGATAGSPRPFLVAVGKRTGRKSSGREGNEGEGWGGVRAEKIFPLLEKEDKLRAVVGFKKEEAMCLVTRPLPLISTSKTENQLIRATPAAPPPAHPAL